jgi:hypothetical protein
MQTCSLKEGPASKRFLRFQHATALYSFPSLACILCCSRSLFASLHTFPLCCSHNIICLVQRTVLIHTHSPRTCVRIRAYLGYFSLGRRLKKSSSNVASLQQFYRDFKVRTHKNIISRMNILRLIQLIKNTSGALALCAFKAMCTNTHVSLSLSTTQNA